MRLVDAHADLRKVVGVERWHRIFRMLEIRDQVIGGTPRESLDAGVLHDRLVEIGKHYTEQSRSPTVVLSGVLSW